MLALQVLEQYLTAQFAALKKLLGRCELDADGTIEFVPKEPVEGRAMTNIFTFVQNLSDPNPFSAMTVLCDMNSAIPL